MNVKLGEGKGFIKFIKEELFAKKTLFIFYGK